MESLIHTYTYPNSEIQKVQEVILDSFEDLKILKPVYSKKSFDNLCALYEDFIIKKYHMIFGTIILFTLDEDTNIPFEDYDEEYGKIYDPYVKVSIAFKRNIKIRNGKLVFKDLRTEEFFNELKERKLLNCVKGDRNYVSIMPIGHNMGFLSESEGKVKVNSSFFVFDKFDCATVYDIVGTGIGLNMKDGIIYNPPMFDRETLFVDKDNNVFIKNSSLNDLQIIIDDKTYINKKNCLFIIRPEHKRSPLGGTDIVVVDNKVSAVKKKGGTVVPAGGYIIHLNEEEDLSIKDRTVSYKAYEEYIFGLQVGNSVIVNGKKTEGFVSSFYNFKKFWTTSYPPSMYPLNYEKDRAPRIVLGVNKENKPVILWFEGAGKFGYVPGKESRGASLKEVADIADELGLVNAISLDGGGSAQILVDNKRELLLSDREPVSYKEKERAVSFGLYV